MSLVKVEQCSVDDLYLLFSHYSPGASLKMMSLSEAVSWVATVSTIGLFSSGILTCRKIHQSKSVGVTPHLPFIAAILNCSLWSAYGVIKPDSTIILVNVVGLILQLFYVTVYHTYADNKFYIRRDFLLAVSIIALIVCYFTIFVYNRDQATSQLGVVCNFFTIIFFASPLATMAEVIRNKSTETMSFPLTMMSLLTTSSWATYGVLIKDIYVQFPNFMGLILSVVQLSLFLFFGGEKKRTVSLENPA